MSEDVVIIERDGPVAVISINRPFAKNAVDPATARRLADAFATFDEDETALAAVFVGAHGTFCAGADLKAVSRGDYPEFEPLEGPIAARDRRGPMGPSLMRLSKPVIGAISGHAVAGGLELALWCDLRVVEEDAILGVFCRRWGVPLVDGGTVRLPRLIGHSQAMDLILTGRPVVAEEALRMGLANRVTPPGAARAEAVKLAQEIARFPQRCMLNDRLSAIEQWDLPIEEALRNERRLGRETLLSGESAAGATRFAGGKGRGGDFDDI